jgi:hypothetical protein
VRDGKRDEEEVIKVVGCAWSLWSSVGCQQISNVSVLLLRHHWVRTRRTVGSLSLSLSLCQ